MWAVAFPRLARWTDRHQPAVSLKGAGRISLGAHTYWSASTRFIAYRTCDSIEIGNYCSVSPRVHVLSGADHSITSITTYPLELLGVARRSGVADRAPERILIGNDVWIGTSAIVLGGVAIGDGAVIGAGAVVTSDVEPYAIVAGVPARLISRRFTEAERSALLGLRWWDWPPEVITERQDSFERGDVAALVDFAVREGLAHHALEGEPAGAIIAGPIVAATARESANTRSPREP